MPDDEKLILRINLSGKHREIFEEIKRKNPLLDSNAAIIRYCLELADKPFSLHIREDYILEMNSLLKHRNIRVKYEIADQKEFINKSLNYFIEKLKKDRLSLYDYALRKYLSPEETELTVSLIGLLNSSKKIRNIGVTVSQLTEKLNWPREKVKKILQDFKVQDYVVTQEISGDTYYGVPFPE